MENWSPDQITESWKKKQKEELSLSVKISKDTVYDWIYTQYDPKELKKHLRRKHKAYRDRKKEVALG
jgi:IS30 family transposase